MKEIDDTPLPESESEDPIEAIWEILQHIEWNKLNERLEKLEKELALALEQRVTVRAPECQEDPEWYS